MTDRLPMACIHDDDGEKEADTARAAIVAELECEDKDLVSAILYNLHWNYHIDVEYSADMWFGISAEQWGKGGERRAYVECDRFEDGLVSIYNWAKTLPEGE